MELIISYLITVVRDIHSNMGGVFGTLIFAALVKKFCDLLCGTCGFITGVRHWTYT